MKLFSNYIKEHLSTPKDCKAFVIIKPGFLGYADEIHKYITDKGFIMHDHTNPQKLSDEQAHKLYEPHKDKDFYGDLCNYMTSGDIIASEYVWDYDKHPGVNTISLMNEIKDHFRKKYGKDEMRNVMHSSDSLKNVQREGKIIFN